jgi:hypothetical protein
MDQRAYVSLLGILYTDGCVSPKGGSWRIIVSNNSPAVIDAFGEALRTCFGKSIRRLCRGKLHVGILDSKQVGQLLIDRHGTFRTESCHGHQGCPYLRGGRKPCRSCEPLVCKDAQYPPSGIPHFGSESEVAVFLRAAFSCDGGVNLYVARRGNTQWLIRNVYLACKHPLLIQQYSSLLLDLGVKSRVIESDWRVLIQGREPIRRYAERIGFLLDVKIGAGSRFWEGASKSEVLAKLLDSYGNPREVYDLPQFCLNTQGNDIVRAAW